MGRDQGRLLACGVRPERWVRLGFYSRERRKGMRLPSNATHERHGRTLDAAGPKAAVPMRRGLGQAACGWVLLAAICASVTPGMAQQKADQGPAVPELKLNPLLVLRDFEASANDPYELGRGDEISIDFAGRPELSSKRIVGPDGRVTMPLRARWNWRGRHGSRPRTRWSLR